MLRGTARGCAGVPWIPWPHFYWVCGEGPPVVAACKVPDVGGCRCMFKVWCMAPVLADRVVVVEPCCRANSFEWTRPVMAVDIRHGHHAV